MKYTKGQEVYFKKDLIVKQGIIDRVYHNVGNLPYGDYSYYVKVFNKDMNTIDYVDEDDIFIFKVK